MINYILNVLEEEQLMARDPSKLCNKSFERYHSFNRKMIKFIVGEQHLGLSLNSILLG